MTPSPKSRTKYKVKNSRALSEKEALALISAAAFRSGGAYDAMKNQLFRMINTGQNYGFLSAEGASGEKMSDTEGKKAATAINVDLRKRKMNFALRYIPSSDGFVFAPLKKIQEAFGTGDSSSGE